MRGEIVFDAVTFHYAQRPDTAALHEFSLRVQPGETVALVGPSGAGKSTLLSLLLRFHDPQAGRITLDGIDLRELDLDALREAIALVPQSPTLFAASAADNIRYGRLDATEEEVRQAAAAAEAETFLDALPDGFASELGERGARLSGGQQQRIGVIRALAAEAPLLLMDEPFGAVDPINREMIQNEFFEMQRALNKTVIMVSHDIDEAIKLGDKIAIFRGGKLLQMDHPDTLLAHPADDFVSNFVGQDSTLKRLLLVKAEDAADNAPSVSPETPVAEALELMDELDRRYVVVTCADNKALGYVRRRDLHRQSGTCGQYLREFNATAAYDEHLRILLSRMYEFNRSWLPVMDAERVFLGEVTQESIAAYLSSGRSRGAKTSIVSPADIALA